MKNLNCIKFNKFALMGSIFIVILLILVCFMSNYSYAYVIFQSDINEIVNNRFIVDLIYLADDVDGVYDFINIPLVMYPIHTEYLASGGDFEYFEYADTGEYIDSDFELTPVDMERLNVIYKLKYLDNRLVKYKNSVAFSIDMKSYQVPYAIVVKLWNNDILMDMFQFGPMNTETYFEYDRSTVNKVNVGTSYRYDFVITDDYQATDIEIYLDYAITNETLLIEDYIGDQSYISIPENLDISPGLVGDELYDDFLGIESADDLLNWDITNYYFGSIGYLVSFIEIIMGLFGGFIVFILITKIVKRFV